MRAAVGYLERVGGRGRRGHGGAVVEEASGLVAAAFRHRTSRAGDPQLHTHVLVANLGRGLDGRWSALDGRRLYAHARTASFVYQAVLRGELTRTLGVEWSPVRKGIAEVVGVRRRVLAGVQPAAGGDRGGARRARDVGRARGGGRGAGDAAPEGPRRDAPTSSPASGAAGGGARARAATSSALIIGAAPGRREPTRALAAPVRAARRPRRSDPSQRDVHARRGPTGALRAAAGRRARRSRDARGGRGSLPRVATRVAAGRRRGARERRGVPSARRPVVPVDRQRLRYSTPAQLALEQRLLDRVLDARARRRAGVAERARAVRGALAARPTLTDEQRAVVERLCRDGDGSPSSPGGPGTGQDVRACRRARGVAGRRPSGARRRDGAPRGRRAPGRRRDPEHEHVRAARRPAARGAAAGAVRARRRRGRAWSPTRDIAELVDAVARRRGQARARRRPSPAARAARPAARSARSCSAASRSSCARTSARSTPGSARRSTSSATAEPSGARRVRRARRG